MEEIMLNDRRKIIPPDASARLCALYGTGTPAIEIATIILAEFGINLRVAQVRRHAASRGVRFPTADAGRTRFSTRGAAMPPKAQEWLIHAWTETQMPRAEIRDELEARWGVTITADQVSGRAQKMGIHRPTVMRGKLGPKALFDVVMARRTLEAFQRPLMPVRPDKVCQELRRFPAPPGGFRMGVGR
jgi:hypothetical protein